MYFSHDWLSCSLPRSCQSNSNIIITWEHLKIVYRFHTFHLNPTLRNLKVYSSSFIHLKLLTQSAKTIKIKINLLNVSLIFCSSSLRHLGFLIWDSQILFESLFFQFLLIKPIIISKLLISFNFNSTKLNYEPLRWPSFSFWLLVLSLYISTLNWLTIFNFFNLTPDLINFSPYIQALFSVWSLVLNFFNQVPNCPSNFNIYTIKPLIWPN
jgi:hypothetical protein